MMHEWTTIEAADDLRLGAVMPAWFAGRMMADQWQFALLLSTGHTMLIRRIDAIHVSPTGQTLIDVEMSEDAPEVSVPGTPFGSPTGRTRATIGLAHVVAAFEVADTPQEEDEFG